jgi:hypothetical protein
MNFDVSGVLQNLFVAIAAKLCGHGGKNTVSGSPGRAQLRKHRTSHMALSCRRNHCGTPSRRI